MDTGFWSPGLVLIAVVVTVWLIVQAVIACRLKREL
jgi:hypothetical protein